ncbi:MAG: NAD(P)-binding domain-containing protein [Planctomycetes bacterium]|nr:NAD(P)-binding domain-containing protein [Planctomycetota bacterium]
MPFAYCKLPVDLFAFAIPVVLLMLSIAALLRRRHELAHFQQNLADRTAAKARGSHRARLQHPKVDLANCIGCGACVRACPEDGVLALAYGQAVVVHGARCVGHGLCAKACPTAAIALTLGDITDRRDLPAIDENGEAVGTPGLFLAGEITGFALVRTAVQHGANVAREIAGRLEAAGMQSAGGRADSGAIGRKQPHDVVVVGLGPAGLACMLAAEELGLNGLGIDQTAEIGGTVASYPRRKLVMTQPMDLPLHGRLSRLEYTKEELIELWQGLAEQHELPVHLNTRLESIQSLDDGTFRIMTSRGRLHARNVVLALGRRGSPRRLGVPGEDLPKVAYSLLDAESYQDRAILVVGGGDSAIEAAIGLSEQPGNTVTLSYRQAAFSRLKSRNEERIEAAMRADKVRVLFESTVEEIAEDVVILRCKAGAAIDAAGNQAADDDHGNGGVATATEVRLVNDEVFIFAGGTPPFPLLEAAGVSFDPSLRPPEQVDADRGTGLLIALSTTLAALVGLFAWRQWYSGYYDLAAGLRVGLAEHDYLRPQGTVGLLAGLAAATLLLLNLLYLWRRSPRFGRRLPGSLKGWMSMHVATGLGASLCALLHSGYQLREGAGGHALMAMIVVVAAGVVGRWFYAFVPRAQNGRQQDLEELQTQVAAIAGEWDRYGRGFGAHVRRHVDELATGATLGRGFCARVVGLLRSQLTLRREMRRLRLQAHEEGIPDAEVHHIISLARRSHRLAMQLLHFEEVRGLLSTWRWLHRWLALLLTLLTLVHIVMAVRYGGVDFGVLPGFGD